MRPYDDVWEFLQQVGKSLQVSTEEKESTKRVVLTGQFVTWKSQLAVGKVRSGRAFLHELDEEISTLTGFFCAFSFIRTIWKA